MTQSQFPVFADHSVIVCHNCEENIEQPPACVCDDGFPPGRGQYRAYCSKCDMRTWYDVEPGEPT